MQILQIQNYTDILSYRNINTLLYNNFILSLPSHKMHKNLFLLQQHVLQTVLEPCPLTYRSTCPAERSRMWEDTGRGRPFLSQLSCGGGEPVATHSMLTELSRTVVNCSTVSLLPSITGGTEKAIGEQNENKLFMPSLRTSDSNCFQWTGIHQECI